MSTRAPALLVVGGDESAEAAVEGVVEGAGTETVTPGVVELVATVVRGGDTMGAVAGVDVDLDGDVVWIVSEPVTTVSDAAVDDPVEAAVEAESDVSSPPLHDAIVDTSSATTTAVLRGVTRSIMSVGRDKPTAMRENERSLAIAGTSSTRTATRHQRDRNLHEKT
jgi:hypothetical protein